MEIFERRMVKRGNSALIQLRIRWSSSTTDTTWEDYDTLRHRFPAASIWQDDEPAASETDETAAEEEAFSEEEGSVTPPFPDVGRWQGVAGLIS